ncbi:MAG TPA: twin-arginine translocase subunit TatC [Vicinamibacterales bacterium]|nr:twin-arginine translocase subunit TatC [Vicinamibacterales bacterium]
MSLAPLPGPFPVDPGEVDVTPYTVNSPPPETTSPFVGGAAPDDDEPPEGRMTFLEHLDELRKRITHAVVALLGGFLIAFAFIEKIWIFVYARLTANIPGGKLIYTEPGEAFFLYLKMAAVAGLLIASPYVMYQLWLFIAPGLYANEKKLAVPFVFFATLLFISGAAFSHYILFPFAWDFFGSFSNDFLAFTPRVEPVWGLYVKLLLAMGLIFQLPMLMFVLARFGMVTAGFLIKNFKYAVLIIFVIAAIVTPDASVVPQVIMAGSMVTLYILSIAVVWMFAKKRPEEEPLAP